MHYKRYSDADLEEIAKDLSERYNPKRLVQPEPIDVFDLIDLIGANTAIDYLSPDREYLGATIFNDMWIWMWPGNPYYTGMIPEKKLYKAGTIIIDADLDASTIEQDIYIENFTVLHECMHFLMHESYFKNTGVLSYQYGQSHKPAQKASKDLLYKIERQADYAAAAFLMPPIAVKNAFFEQFNTTEQSLPLPLCYETKSGIKDLAKRFSVNLSPMEYRLKDLGLIEKNFSY